MSKRIAICVVFIGTIVMGFTITGATTASYQWIARLVNASNFVVNFTASATAANYQHTCQIVDQTGTVLNPGTASATTASPDCTIRVVDASGFVQSAFSAGPTATPTPSFVAGSTAQCAGANCVLTVPAGTTDGDILYIHATHNTGSTYAGTAGTKTFFYGVGPSTNFVTGQTTELVKRWSGSDSGITTITFGGSLSGDEICAATFRGIANPDLYSLTWSTPATSTTPTAVAITTNFTNDLLIYSAGYGGNPTSVSAVATGFTNAINHTADASNYGCVIEYKLQAAAGTTGTVAATISASTANVAILSTFQP